MFSKRAIAFSVIAAVLIQLSCSVGGFTILPSSDSQEIPSNGDDSSGSAPTSTSISLEVGTQEVEDAIPLNISGVCMPSHPLLTWRRSRRFIIFT